MGAWVVIKGDVMGATVDCSRVRTGRRPRSGIPYTVDPRTQPRTRIRVRTRLQSTEAESDIPVHVRVHVHDSCSRTQNGEESKGRSFTTPFYGCGHEMEGGK